MHQDDDYRQNDDEGGEGEMLVDDHDDHDGDDGVDEDHEERPIRWGSSSTVVDEEDDANEIEYGEYDENEGEWDWEEDWIEGDAPEDQDVQEGQVEVSEDPDGERASEEVRPEVESGQEDEYEEALDPSDEEDTESSQASEATSPSSGSSFWLGRRRDRKRKRVTTHGMIEPWAQLVRGRFFCDCSGRSRTRSDLKHAWKTPRGRSC